MTLDLAFRSVSSHCVYCKFINIQMDTKRSGDRSLTVGPDAGMTRSGDRSLTVGPDAGMTRNGDRSLTVGPDAGMTRNGDRSLTVGPDAGIEPSSIPVSTSVK